jgi:hypothetical protein
MFAALCIKEHMSEDRFITSLINCDFLESFRRISIAHQSDADGMEAPKKEIIINAYKKNGIEAKYFSRERFYRVTLQRDGYEICSHMSPKYGLCELMLYVIYEDPKLVLGGPYGSLCRKLGVKELPKKPKFISAVDISTVLRLNHEIVLSFDKAYIENA